MVLAGPQRGTGAAPLLTVPLQPAWGLCHFPPSCFHPSCQRFSVRTRGPMAGHRCLAPRGCMEWSAPASHAWDRGRLTSTQRLCPQALTTPYPAPPHPPPRVCSLAAVLGEGRVSCWCTAPPPSPHQCRVEVRQTLIMRFLAPRLSGSRHPAGSFPCPGRGRAGSRCWMGTTACSQLWGSGCAGAAQTCFLATRLGLGTPPHVAPAMPAGW